MPSLASAPSATVRVKEVAAEATQERVVAEEPKEQGDRT
jgi:hypothetical protein